MTNGREAFLAKALSQRGDCLRSDGSTKYGEWFGRQVHDGGYARGDFCAMGLLWCADQTGQLGVRGGDLSTIEFNTLNGQCAERTRRGGDALGFGDPAWHASAPALPGGGSCWIG